MRKLRTISICVLLTAMGPLGGCKLFHKQAKNPPPQAQAPSIPEPTPQQAPPQQTPPAPASSEPNRPQPTTESTPPAATAPAPKPKPRTNTTAKKPATPPPATAPATPPASAEKPKPSVIQEGSAPPSQQGQLSAGLTHDQALHQQMTTAQLTESTELNLKAVTRSLSVDEQAMVQHIRSYLQQSRSATAEGDLERAYNLAMKAHLLSDELVKGR